MSIAKAITHLENADHIHTKIAENRREPYPGWLVEMGEEIENAIEQLKTVSHKIRVAYDEIDEINAEEWHPDEILSNQREALIQLEKAV